MNQLNKAAPPAPRQLDIGLLARIVGYHLHLAEMVIFRDFRATMGPSGLTQIQFAVLELVHCNPAVSQVELSGQLAVDKASMMAIVDRLEQASLLIRRASKIDRRRQELYVTLKGGQKLEEMRALIVAHEQALFANIPASELARLTRSLKKISSRAVAPDSLVESVHLRTRRA